MQKRRHCRGKRERADSQVCHGLPDYLDAWKTDNVAWACHWPNKIRGHYSDFHFSQGGEVLWLVLDSMLEVHPDDRSSADYVHDEAQKILERMAGDELSDDSDEGAATPKPYECSEASTLCLEIGRAHV